MKNKLWGIENNKNNNLKVVLFISRKKDNKDLLYFKERRESFVIDSEYANNDRLLTKFEAFKNNGQKGEVSRMYVSVNNRDSVKVHKELQKFLIDEPDFDLSYIQAKIAGIAAKKECAAEKKWMFDFDNDDSESVNFFIKDIPEEVNPTLHKTPNGFAIITDRGFDCRELLKKYPCTTLKRDDLLCVTWGTKL